MFVPSESRRDHTLRKPRRYSKYGGGKEEDKWEEEDRQEEENRQEEEDCVRRNKFELFLHF